MSKQIEAMKLALARLQARTDTADLDAIAALNDALAEQPAPVQQEPEWYHFVSRGEDCFVPYEGQAPADATRLYTRPQAREPEQPAKRHGYKEAYIEAMVASNEAGFVGLSAAETIRELANMLDKRAEQPAQQETKELFGYEIWNLFYRTKEELFEALVDKGIEWATPRGTENGLSKEWIEANIREVYVHGTYALAEQPAQRTPAEVLDWLADQHRAQCGEDRPVQHWIRKMKEMLP